MSDISVVNYCTSNGNNRAGVARYDYAARAYFTAIPRFDRPDALAGK